MDLKERAALPAGRQLRSYPAQFEVHGMSGSKVELRGYASTFEAPYEMYDAFGPYQEVVRAGAFSKTLTDGCDTCYLSNHEGLTMARTKSGSLRLSQDTTGLETLATVNTARGDVRDLVTAIEDGDVDEMSFAFRVMRQQWSPDCDERALVELNLDKGEVSAVNYGANPATSLGLQRAFRSSGALELHRAAESLGRGEMPAEAGAIAELLERFAACGTRTIDPAAVSGTSETTDPVAALVDLDMLRRLHEHDGDRRQLVAGL